tara:strand:- start:85 stop:1014 length:930 start_codon:yes stop_codon:yes gene_type:complete
MSNFNLISIIIPVFNRESLISETLDSILNQTYTNWECLVIDDGSLDNTINILESYITKDNRIRSYSRPDSKLKGANSCRNIGLDKALGDYIVFFDSDDLMTPNHLEVKINSILKYQTDYVITRTKFFNYTNSQIDKYYNFDTYKLTPYNYITQKINWLTYDICIKTQIAKNIRFNELLQSGQEYNYFCKLVLNSVNAYFIDEVVTLRRHHVNSIRSGLKSESKKRYGSFQAHWLTYLEIKEKINAKTKKHLLNVCIENIYLEKKLMSNNNLIFLLEAFKVFKFKGIYFLLFIISIKFSKGYYFKNKLIK